MHINITEIFYLCLQNGKRLETVVKELGELKKCVHQITAEKVCTTVITDIQIVWVTIYLYDRPKKLS